MPPNRIDDVSRETLMQSKKLCLFAEIFQKWQKHINLTASGEDLWERHIVQSVQLLNFFPQYIKSVLDVGTGGGFPGLVAAIYWQEQFASMPDIKFHLVESDTRKCSFLRETARLTGTKIILHNVRIEGLPPQKFDLITARALAPLPKLLDYTARFMGDETVCLFYKGKNYKDELTEALKQWHIKYEVISLSQLSFILHIKDIKHAKK